MKKIVFVVLATMILFGWLSIEEKALAEQAIKPQSAEISFFIGALNGDTNTEAIIAGMPIDVGLDDSVTFGARAAHNFTSHLALEGIIEFSPIDVIAEAGGLSVPIDSTAFFFHGNVVWNIIEMGRFVPYLTGGIGVMVLIPDDPLIKSETDSAFNFGGGGKVFIKTPC